MSAPTWCRRVAAVLLISLVAVLRANAQSVVPAADSASREDAASPDAEVLLWRLVTQDVEYGDRFVTTQDNQLRVRLLHSRAADKYGTIKIPVMEGARISGLTARTTLPDGTVQPVSPKEIREQVVARSQGWSARVRTFAFPNAVAGAVLEYSYRLTMESAAFRAGAFLPLQLEIPVRRCELEFVPLSGRKYAIQTSIAFDRLEPLVERKSGHYATVATEIPAYVSEDLSPGEFKTRLWLRGYYPITDGDLVGYWDAMAYMFRTSLTHYSEPPGQYVKLAHEWVAGTTDPREQIDRIDERLRAAVRNLETMPDSQLAAFADFKGNERPWDALKRGVGTTSDITTLMLLMSRWVGLKPQIVMVAGRWNPFFDRRQETVGQLGGMHIGYKLPDGWYFASPGDPDLPRGWLASHEEGEWMFLPNSPDSLFERAGHTPPDSSGTWRSADLVLTPEGDADGMVRIRATGFEAMQWRDSYDEADPVALQTHIQDRLRERLPDAVVDSVHRESLTGRSGRFAMQYHVRVPRFATQVGQRLLVPAFFFNKGVPAALQSSVRHSAIAIDFANLSVDSVRIHAPAQMRFETMTTEPHVSLPWGQLERSAVFEDEGQVLVSVRQLRVGDRPIREYPPFVHPAAKAAYARMAEQDAQIVVARVPVSAGTGKGH